MSDELIEQPKSNTRTVVAIVGLAVAVATVSIVMILKSKTTPIMTEKHPQKVTEWWPAPDFALENVDGKTVTKKDLAGKIWAIAFIFTRCPGPCSDITEVMKLIQENLKDVPNFSLLSVTVDPDFDSREVLREYAVDRKADLSNWYFLRGTKEAIGDMQSNGFKIGNPNVLTEHSQRISLVDASGKVVDFFMGAGPARAGEWQRLVATVKTMASAN